MTDAQPPSLRQFGWFAAAGTLGFIVDASLLYATAGLLGWYGARAFSFVGAATATWLINRRWTFRPPLKTSAATTSPATRTPLLQEYLQYLASMLGGAALNYGTYVAVLHYTNGAAIPYAPLLGVAAGSIAGLFANFLVTRYWVFRHRL